MKTVFIDCSPKQRLSASGFVATFTRMFVFGRKVQCKLRTPKDFQPIFEEIKDADSIVFCMPLYVDGIPSHILPFLKEMENKFTNKNVYVIANNGFIEGRQNEPLMQNMENFCHRANLNWCGGLGIGGGVMMNVMRIMFCVVCALSLLQVVLNGFDFSLLKDSLDDALVILILCCGIISFDLWLAYCINNGKEYGKHYTRIMLPSFVFIVCADIFFTIISLFQGGIFRGWFSKKKPTM
ncbi:MAG: NAD(P)H-dependent oxidoreductase [Firmicutes bacterium]|nr:NAD(P)H-dependent oxidoreductase [Bacillota bacterium]